jgi:four helix bundle protein
MGERISTFKGLQVYQLACELDELIFQETKQWPREEKYALIDQIRRSSRAIGANIAESWAKRRYPAHFVSKLTDADGELQETMHWLGRAAAYRYLTSERLEALEALCHTIGSKLGKMMQKPDSFSRSPVHRPLSSAISHPSSVHRPPSSVI